MPEPVRFRFGTPDLPDDDPSGFGLRVVNFFGEETISQPFWFVLNLTSRDPNLDFEAVVNQPGRLTLERGTNRCYLHGLVASFEQGERDGDWHLYRAVLRPRLWVLSLTYRSRVFRHLSVPEIVRTVLEEHGVPHTIELRESYTPRDYTVQHEETDLAFVTRLLAHEGIRFAFAHGERREEVLLYDSRGQDPWVEGPAEVRYVPPDGLVAGVEEHVSKFVIREQVVPGKVALRDYNPDTPSADLGMEDEAEGGGPGEVFEYAQEYGDRSAGKRAAQVRREELAAQRRLVAGRGTSIGFRAGHRFSLFAHPREDFNEDYLLVRVRHFGGQEADFGTVGRREVGADGIEGTDYRNEFGCAPARVPFRMPRLALVESFFGDTFFDARFEQRLAQTFNVNAQITNSTTIIGGGGHGGGGKMLGLMTAPIEGDGPYGAVDAKGNYVAQMPFDRESNASRDIRLAQPYAGEGEAGFHFPAHAGNEIVFACIDGDPNQPVALGFLPNAEHPSPVTSENSSRHIIQTTSRNLFQIEDASGTENIKLFSPRGNGKLDIGHDKVGIGLRTDLNVSTFSGKATSIHGAGGITLNAWPNGGPGKQVLGKLAPTLTLLSGFWFDYAKAPPAHSMHKPDTFSGKVYQEFKRAASGAYPFDGLFDTFKSLLKLHGQAETLYNLFKSEDDENAPSDPSLFDVLFPSTSDIKLNAEGSFSVLTGKDASIITGLGIGLKAIGSIDLVAADSIGILSAKGFSAFTQEGGITLASNKDPVKLESRDATVFVEAGENVSLQAGSNIYIATNKERKGNIVMSAEEYHLYGNDALKLEAKNDYVLKAGKKIDVQAQQGTTHEDKKEIILKCGQSTIELKPAGIVIKNGQNSIELGASGITIKGMKIVGEANTAITLDAKVKATVKGAMVETSAQSLNTVSGALVKIG